MAAAIPNPNIDDRSNGLWWAAPIGVGVVLPTPVLMSAIPTSDPGVEGEVWANSDVLTQSTP